MTTHTAPTARTWIKHFRNGFGSADRVQRNAYAYAVAMVLTGGRNVCPSCDMPLDLNRGAEVDRINGSEVDANGSEVYREGTIVYLCRACNASRGELQSRGDDWPNVDAYRAAVVAASAGVPVPTVATARAWWAARPMGAVAVGRWA